MSLPKLFGKEFLPDPNILLNNYDVFMNDPNMDNFLNGSDPKYNPNPNINLRYLYGPDYKINDTDISAPEPSKIIHIEITVFDKNHWNFPTNQDNIITDHPKDTKLTVTNTLKDLRTYGDLVFKNLHKDTIDASEIDLYVSNNTFKFDVTLTTELIDSYQEPTFKRTPEQIKENIQIVRLIKDIFSLNIKVNKTISFGKDNYLPNLNVTYNGKTHGVSKLYIPNSYKQKLQTELKAIEVAPENRDLSEDILIKKYQSKAEEILEPLYKDVFYGIRILPDSTKRKIKYEDIGQPDMLLFPKEDVKLFGDNNDPLYKIVEFHRLGTYKLDFTYGDVSFPNVQDSLKLLKDQTIIKTDGKLYVYNGNETDTDNFVGQQLTFDINDTPGLQAISERLDSTTSLKVEKPAMLETENYFFAVGGKNKNSLSPNFNLKNIISFAPKTKNESGKTEIGTFTEVPGTEDTNYTQTKNLIETLNIDSENCYFQTINNNIFAFVFTNPNTATNGFMYVYKITVEEVADVTGAVNGTNNTYPVLKFQIKTVNQNYFKYPTFKLQENLHKIYDSSESGYSSSYSKLLIIDSAVTFQNQSITTVPSGQTITTKPTSYKAKLLEFVYEPETDQFTLLPKTIVYSDISKEAVLPNEVLASAIKTEVSETQEEQNNNRVITKTFDNVIELSPYLIEDNNNDKTLKKSFLLCHGIWEIDTADLWNSSSEKVFTLLNEASTNYNIDTNQRNFYKNLRKGKEQSLQTNGAILLINPIIGNITYSGAVQLNKNYTSTQLYGKPQIKTNRNIQASQLLKAAYYTRQEEVLFQSLLVRKMQEYKAYHESIKFYDESAPNGWNEDKYITLTQVDAPIVLSADSKGFFEYLLNLCYETRLDKYNDYYYLEKYFNKKEMVGPKLIIPEFFFDIIFNRQMFNINLKVLEWYWDNYTFKDKKFQTHKNNLKYKGVSFKKENIKNILVSFYKNKIKMSIPSILNGSEVTNLFEPIIANIQKNLGQFQSDIKYPTYNFIQNNIQDPSSYRNNINTSNLKNYEDFRYIIIPNNNGSIHSNYLTNSNKYLNHNFKDAQNFTDHTSNCQIIKEYSVESLNFIEDSIFLANFDYYVAPPERGGNDANDGLTPFSPKETCATIPKGSNILFLPGVYDKKVKIISVDGVSYDGMLCFCGANAQNIYGCGDLTVIKSIGSTGPRDCPVFANIESNSTILSQLDMAHYYNLSDGKFSFGKDPINVRNMKIIYDANKRTSYSASINRFSVTGSIFKNINFEITGNYTLQYDNYGGTIYYQNCTFTGGTKGSHYSGKYSITTAPDNAMDTLIKNPISKTRKEITFHPQKQKYKPTYTLIPLASSGYYDITQNDLENLANQEQKNNINIPVLNDTRAMTNLTNFKITL